MVRGFSSCHISCQMLRVFGLFHRFGMKKLALQKCQGLHSDAFLQPRSCLQFPPSGSLPINNFASSFNVLIIITKTRRATFSHMNLELKSSNFFFFGVVIQMKLYNTVMKLTRLKIKGQNNI